MSSFENKDNYIEANSTYLIFLSLSLSLFPSPSLSLALHLVTTYLCSDFLWDVGQTCHHSHLRTGTEFAPQTLNRQATFHL